MSDIRNCALGLKCPKKWEDLQPLSNPKIRYCLECGEEVHFCESDEEIVSSIRMNFCIAYTGIAWPETSMGMPVFFPPIEFSINNKDTIKKLTKAKIENFEKITKFSREDLKQIAKLSEFEMMEIDEFLKSRDLSYRDGSDCE